LKYIKIPAGAILEEAPPEMIARHVPGSKFKGNELVSKGPAFLEIEEGRLVRFTDFALLKTGDVAVLYAGSEVNLGTIGGDT
jgi:hypothetical protein